MAGKRLKILFTDGITQEFDPADILWRYNTEHYSGLGDVFTTSGSPNDINDEVITNNKIIVIRERVLAIYPGVDAIALKQRVFLIEYWRLAVSGEREENNPVRFLLYLQWDNASVFYEDIQVLLTGGSTNKDPKESRGGDVSSFALVPGTYDPNFGVGLFDDITYDEHKPTGEGGAGDTEFRCIEIQNNSGQTLSNLKAWVENPNNPISNEGKDSHGYEIALGEEYGTTEAKTAAEETTPTNPVFAEETRDSPLALTSLVTTDTTRVWFRRNVVADPA